MSELQNFEFTPHKVAIAKIREYFKANMETLDIETIREDPYLKTIENMWKGR